MNKKLISGVVLAAGMLFSGSTIPHNAQAAAQAPQLVKGQTGEVTILQNTPLYKLGSNNQMTIVRTLTKGRTYYVYSVGTIDGVTYYGTGNDCYVKGSSQVKYDTPKQRVTITPHNVQAAAQAPQLVKGQTGEVTILQNTPLYKLGSNNQMTIVRTLTKGRTYYVYSVGTIDGVTYYGTGNGCYVKGSSQVKYDTPKQRVTITPHNVQAAAQAPQLVKGQTGEVTILQNTPLYKLGTNNQMTIVRTLTKGRTFYVYSMNKFDGVTYYGTGGGCYVKASSQVIYVTISQSKAPLAGTTHQSAAPITTP